MQERRRKWRQPVAQVKVAIEAALDEAQPEVYIAEVYEQKTQFVFQHFCGSYNGAGKSICEQVA